MVTGASIAVNGRSASRRWTRGPRFRFPGDVAPETLRLSNLGRSAGGFAREPGAPAFGPAGSAATSCKATWMARRVLALDLLGTRNGAAVRVPATSTRSWFTRLHRHRRHQKPDHCGAGSGHAFRHHPFPHTWRNTTLAGYRTGARVNLECDILASTWPNCWQAGCEGTLTVEKVAGKRVLSESAIKAGGRGGCR